MKPFVFRLQTKLDISRREEEIARAKLQNKMAERDGIEAELNLLKTNLEKVEDMARDIARQNSKVYLISISREYIPILKKKVTQCQERLKNIEADLEKLRHDLMQKKREVKTLEKLKEKEWLEYIHELNLEEQKFIDEMAGNTYFRRQNKDN